MANRYWVGGTANWVNVTGSLWATSSGGSPGVATPTTSDDVYFDGNSGTTITCSVVGTANIVNCRSLYFSSSAAGFFKGMFRVSQSVTITVGTTTFTSSVQLSPSASYIGSATTPATLTMVGAASPVVNNLISNGARWPARLNLSRNVIYNIS